MFNLNLSDNLENLIFYYQDLFGCENSQKLICITMFMQSFKIFKYIQL